MLRVNVLPRLCHTFSGARRGGANPGKIGSRLWTNVRGRDLRTRMLFRKSSLVRDEFCTRSSSILTWILKFKPEINPLCNCPTVIISEWLQQSIRSNCIVVTELIHLYISPSPSLITHATTKITHTHCKNREHPFLSIFLLLLLGDKNRLVLSSPVGLQCLWSATGSHFILGIKCPRSPKAPTGEGKSGLRRVCWHTTWL